MSNRSKCLYCNEYLENILYPNTQYHKHCHYFSNRGVGRSNLEALHLLLNYPNVPLPKNTLERLTRRGLYNNGVTELGKLVYNKEYEKCINL